MSAILAGGGPGPLHAIAPFVSNITFGWGGYTFGWGAAAPQHRPPACPLGDGELGDRGEESALRSPLRLSHGSNLKTHMSIYRPTGLLAGFHAEQPEEAVPELTHFGEQWIPMHYRIAL